VLVRLSTPCNGFHVENRDQILVLLLFIFQLHVMDSNQRILRSTWFLKRLSTPCNGFR